MENKQPAGCDLDTIAVVERAATMFCDVTAFHPGHFQQLKNFSKAALKLAAAARAAQATQGAAVCTGCDPAEGFCRDCREAERKAAHTCTSADERALYEAWELSEAERFKGEPLSAEEVQYVLKRWTRDPETYERRPHRWPAFQAGLRARAAQGAGTAPVPEHYRKILAMPDGPDVVGPAFIHPAPVSTAVATADATEAFLAQERTIHRLEDENAALRAAATTASASGVPLPKGWPRAGDRIVIHDFDGMITNCICTSGEQRKKAKAALLAGIKYEIEEALRAPSRAADGQQAPTGRELYEEWVKSAGSTLAGKRWDELSESTQAHWNTRAFYGRTQVDGQQGDEVSAAEHAWRRVTPYINSLDKQQGASRAALSKAAIDEIVYQCRQSGDDSTYAIVNAALAHNLPAQGAAQVEPAAYVNAYVNGDELDNMLDDRTATIQGTPSGWRRTPLYRAAPKQVEVEAARDAAWVREPTEQADYWHWNGDPDHAPMIYHVMWSGTAKKCFISIGQYDITNAIFCDTFGGWWLKIEQPRAPIDRAALAAERGGASD